MKRLSLFLLLFIASFAWGQQGNTVTIPFAGAPTGTCSTIMVATNLATGDYYNCLNGAWNKIATGGGAVISGTIAANQIPKGTAANVIGASSITDDATKVAFTEPLWVTTINDANGNPFLLSSATASAVDSVTITNAATGNPATVTVGMSGTDNNINAIFASKGSGNSELAVGGSTVVFYADGSSGNATVNSGHNLVVTSGTATATTVSGTTSVTTPSITGVTTNVASTIQSGVDANTTGATATLTLRGEAVSAGGANNLAGGDVVISGGVGTGTATPAHVKIQSPSLGLAAANTQNTQVTRYTIHVKAGSTSSATPTTILNIASATNTTWGLKLLIHVQLISSTPNVCGTTQEFSLTGTNNNGAFGTVAINAGTAAAGTLSTLCSTGTLTLAVTATAANPSVISVTPTWGTITSITSATITVEIWNPSQQEISLL